MWTHLHVAAEAYLMRPFCGFRWLFDDECGQGDLSFLADTWIIIRTEIYLRWRTLRCEVVRPTRYRQPHFAADTSQGLKEEFFIATNYNWFSWLEAWFIILKTSWLQIDKLSKTKHTRQHCQSTAWQRHLSSAFLITTSTVQGSACSSRNNWWDCTD